MLSGARVLVVDDDPAMCELLADGLSLHGFTIETATSVADAQTKLTASEFDAVVTDLRMPGRPAANAANAPSAPANAARSPSAGIALCQWSVERWPDVPVLVHTAFGDFEAAVEAMRAGAFDFLSKPVNLELVRMAVERAVRHRRLRREVTRLRTELDEASGVRELLGDSPPMRRVHDLVRRVASTDSTVLVTGESGTGKELVARAIHRLSARADGPFVAINCGALPEPLLESELFGHEKGAFTDAHATRRGLFAQADGGVLFLDEIGELPIALQAKVLRAIQERSIRPLGGSRETRFDARIVVATNKNLEALVEAGRFREDLFFRVAVIEIELPPLRTRGTDILALAQHFLRRAAQKTNKPARGFGPAVAEKLLAYSWPGNVRELENAIERAVTLTEHDVLTIDDLPPRIVHQRPSQLVLDTGEATELVTLDEMERRYIHKVLEATGGSRTRAAKILGVDRTTLWRKLDRARPTNAESKGESPVAEPQRDARMQRSE